MGSMLRGLGGLVWDRFWDGFGGGQDLREHGLVVQTGVSRGATRNLTTSLHTPRQSTRLQATRLQASKDYMSYLLTSWEPVPQQPGGPQGAGG